MHQPADWFPARRVVAMVALGAIVVAAVALGLLSRGGASGAVRGRTTISVADPVCSSRPQGFDTTRPGSRRRLVPAGPDSVILCRYGPVEPHHPQGLVAYGGGGAKTARRLARALDRLKRVPRNAAFNCPSDDGESIDASFGYAIGRGDRVELSLDGCQFATNGHVTAFAHAAVARMERLVPWSGTIKGRIETCGGPYPGRCRTESIGSCSPRCWSADEVALYHSSGARYPWVRVHSGHFSARVEPGRYWLTLMWTRGDRSRAAQAVRATVRNGRVTRVRFVFDVP